MKDEILELAKKIGIKKSGFSKGAFVALFPYFIKESRGNISVYARSEDYHTIAERKLKIIEEKMHQLGAVNTEIHVDKGILNDRIAAYEAGLGFFGKNGMLICEEFGSFFFIGQIIHDLEIIPDAPLGKVCMNCGECIKRCIGGALSADGFCIDKCVSHISQKKGELSESEEKLIVKSGLCWGCDICQTVCPYNKRLETTAMPEFYENRIESLYLCDIENMSNREFKRKYGNYAFSWRGKSVLERNLKILGEESEVSNE